MLSSIEAIKEVKKEKDSEREREREKEGYRKREIESVGGRKRGILIVENDVAHWPNFF